MEKKKKNIYIYIYIYIHTHTHPYLYFDLRKIGIYLRDYTLLLIISVNQKCPFKLMPDSHSQILI